MKQHLLETFRYNDWANKQLLQAILLLKEKDESIRLFSHLINSQDKWFNRITKEIDDKELRWFGEIYSETELNNQWEKSVNCWIAYLERMEEAALENYIEFKRADNNRTIRVKIKNVMLQLNYHSVHHRAQINSLVSRQGIKPPQTDFIFTALEELS